MIKVLFVWPQLWRVPAEFGGPSGSSQPGGLQSRLHRPPGAAAGVAGSGHCHSYRGAHWRLEKLRHKGPAVLRCQVLAVEEPLSVDFLLDGERARH